MPDAATPEPDASTPDRTYLRVQPAADRTAADAAVQFARQVHHLGAGTTVEICLATRGTDDGVSYHLGVTGDGDEDTDALARLERACRAALPGSYGLDRVAWHPRDVLGHDTDGTTTTATVGLEAHADRPKDWQTRLAPYADFVQDPTRDEGLRPPLATVADALADSPVPAVYQALLQPFRDWRGARDERVRAIESHQDTWRDQALNAVVGDPAPDDLSLPPADRSRLDALAGRDARHAFVLTVRAVAVGGDGTPETVVRSVGQAFAGCGGPHHDLDTRISTSTGTDGDRSQALLTRTVHDPTYESLGSRLTPGATASRGIVVDAREAPAFVALDGARLPDAARRGLDPTPDERARDPRPTAARLARYDAGMPLGQPVDADGRQTDPPVHLPPALQPLHTAWFGRTGSGKSTALIAALLENHAATDGLDLLVDPKGDGLATDYLRAHHARFGGLDDVAYFDCSDVVPAISFFDVRDEVAAGVPRTTAVEDTVDHYLEILRGVMGDDRFDQAVRAPDVIRYLAKAQFDPVHGSDAFSHRDLHAAARRMAERQSAPAVSDDDLERMLAGLVANRARTFDEIMQGVANRMEKLPADRRLARIFNHAATGDRETTVTATPRDTPAGGGERQGRSVPPDTSDGAGTPAEPPAHLDTAGRTRGTAPAGAPGSDPTPHFDLGDLLDEDVVVVLDTGGLRSEARRVLTLVVLSNLWTALRRRKQRGAGTRRDAVASGDDGEDAAGDDDAGAGDGDADADPLVNLYLEEAATVVDTDLLRDLLRQGRSFDCGVTLAMQFPAQVRETAPEVYAELLNDVGTVVSGPVPFDRGLARRYATGETTPDEVEPRLRALTRGEWLAALPAAFGERAPQPFVLESVPEPAMPTDPATERAVARCLDRTRRHAGLALADPSAVDGDDGDAPDSAGNGDGTARLPPLDTALAHTRRLPDPVEYDTGADAVRCTDCDTRYDPSVEGLERAVGCCNTLETVDRDDVPVCDLHLKLTPAEVHDSDWSVAQLLFCQAVYNAQQGRYSRLEYDLLCDSMLRLREYVGIDDAAIDDLVEAGLLRDEGDHPHRLYGVTPDGRTAIGETYRSGTDYGHGKGDIEESSQHVLAVEAGRRWLEQDYVDDPDSDVVEAVPYYDLDGNRRLDLAGLDADGDIRVTLEAERINNDAAEAVPADFDKMASCEPDEAIWVVLTRGEGHRVTSVLADPPDGEPRVEKTYSENSPPRKFRYDTPGLTRMVAVRYLRDSMLEDGS